MKESEFDKLMADNGISKSIMQGTAYPQIKKIITEHPEYCLADYPQVIADAAKLLEAVNESVGSLKLEYIQNADTRDSILAYKNMLQATKDVFGEDKMTPEVITAAIQAASYTAYRNIMGQAAGPIRRY